MEYINKSHEMRLYLGPGMHTHYTVDEYVRLTLFEPLYLYQMVAQNTMRTYGVNHLYLLEGIWLHRKSRQIRFFLL